MRGFHLCGIWRYSTINPNTVSRVYKELEMEGVCFTRRGMGTFVTEDPERVQQLKEEMAGTLIREFLEGMGRLGTSRAQSNRTSGERTVGMTRSV